MCKERPPPSPALLPSSPALSLVSHLHASQTFPCKSAIGVLGVPSTGGSITFASNLQGRGGGCPETARLANAGRRNPAMETLPTATCVPALAVHAAVAGVTPVTRVTGTAAWSTVMLLKLADGRF